MKHNTLDLISSILEKCTEICNTMKLIMCSLVIFIAPRRKNQILKVLPKVKWDCPYLQKYLKVRHYRASHTIASFHRNETDKAKSMKYTSWLPEVPNKALKGLRSEKVIFLEG